MTTPSTDPDQKRLAIGTAVVVVIIILLLVGFSWVLTRGVEDDTQNQIPSNAPGTSQSVPNQPNDSSESTGGGTATGTGTSNDPAIDVPSPAGGVDTNGRQPSGNATPAQ